MSRRYSHSALKTAQRCMKQWYYKYIERLDPADRPKYFERGSELHELLELLYIHEREGTQETLEAFTSALRLAPDEYRSILERYIAEYFPVPDSWTILHIEEDMMMKVGTYDLVFKADMIVEIDGEVWVVDHKTVANIPEESDPYNMTDFQHLLYLEGVAQQGYEDVAGFIFNYVRSKPPTEPKLIKDGSRIADLRRIDTDYDSLYRFAERHGMLEYPDVQDKLKILKHTPNKFFQRHFIPTNPTAVEEAYNDTLMALSALDEAEFRQLFPRHVVGGFGGASACARCAYQPLCFADMTGINREPMLLDYIERPKR